MQNSVFGFIVSNAIHTKSENRIYCGLIKEQLNIDKALEHFCEIENVDATVPNSIESKFCNEHYRQTHMRDHTGRYRAMHLKEDPASYGNSKNITLKRLNALLF